MWHFSILFSLTFFIIICSMTKSTDILHFVCLWSRGKLVLSIELDKLTGLKNLFYFSWIRQLIVSPAMYTQLLDFNVQCLLGFLISIFLLSKIFLKVGFFYVQKYFVLCISFLKFTRAFSCILECFFITILEIFTWNYIVIIHACDNLQDTIKIWCKTNT